MQALCKQGEEGNGHFFLVSLHPGIFRHADTGYALAQDVAHPRGAKIPGLR